MAHNLLLSSGLSFESCWVYLSSGFHPQSNGQTKRLNLELETGLRLLCSREPSSWSQNVGRVEYANNFLPFSATGLTFLGHQCLTSVCMPMPTPPSLRQCHLMRSVQTRDALLLLQIKLARDYGYRPRTSYLAHPVRISPRISLVRSSSPRWSTR